MCRRSRERKTPISLPRPGKTRFCERTTFPAAPAPTELAARRRHQFRPRPRRTKATASRPTTASNPASSTVAFYQNGTIWTDATAQGRQNLKNKQIAFNSDDYFALLQKHPEAAAWLALGSEVDIVLDDTLYVVR